MENITIGQVAVGVAFLVALITGVTSLKKSIRSWIESALKDRFDSIEKSQKERLESLERTQNEQFGKINKRFEDIVTSQNDILDRLNNVDLENCKNYLVTYLAEVARGEPKSETERLRFWEEYGYYISRGGNSYVKEETERQKKEGNL